jgi:hypothetical protein
MGALSCCARTWQDRNERSSIKPTSPFSAPAAESRPAPWKENPTHTPTADPARFTPQQVANSSATSTSMRIDPGFTPKILPCTILKEHSLNSTHGIFPQVSRAVKRFGSDSSRCGKLSNPEYLGLSVSAVVKCFFNATAPAPIPAPRSALPPQTAQPQTSATPPQQSSPHYQ